MKTSTFGTTTAHVSRAELVHQIKFAFVCLRKGRDEWRSKASELLCYRGPDQVAALQLAAEIREHLEAHGPMFDIALDWVNAAKDTTIDDEVAALGIPRKHAKTIFAFSRESDRLIAKVGRWFKTHARWTPAAIGL